jgi:hypothetical protein
VDQTPLEFDFPAHRTYDLKGAKSVNIRTGRSGWDKRQRTI